VRARLAVLVHYGLTGLRPITFADNNERLWNTDIEGVPVLAALYRIGSLSRLGVFRSHDL